MDDTGDSYRNVALVSVFGPRDERLYNELLGTVWLAPYLGDANLHVVDIKAIRSVVGMVPDSDVHIDVNSFTKPHFQEGANYFCVEKLGLEASHRSGDLETVIEEE